MILGKDTKYYIIAAAVFFALKAYLFFAEGQMLLFLLKPVSALTGLATATNPIYVAGDGYHIEELNIIIDNSCSGYNFMLICFAVLAVAFLDKLIIGAHKAMAVPVALASAYVLTLFVNSARIVSAVNLSRMFPAIKNYPWSHEALGAFIYLSFLLIAYQLATYLLHKLTINAKPAQS